MKHSLLSRHLNIPLKALLILIFGLFVFNNSNAQTYVSGGIYSNTTWTLAGSPYIVTGDITLFPGANLTIQPGVVVKFHNARSISVGTNSLIAVGTPIDSITFTSDSAAPVKGVYLGIVGTNGNVSFSYCNFDYAGTAINMVHPATGSVKHCTFMSNGQGILQPSNTIIDSCNFTNNTEGAIGGSRDTIEYCTFNSNYYGLANMGGCYVGNCLFSSNAYAVDNYFSNSLFTTFENCQILSNYYGILSGGYDNVEYCQINNNGIGLIDSLNYTNSRFVRYSSISNNNIGIEYYHDSIYCNIICNNTEYNVINENAFNTNRYISNNYWCTSDSIRIDSSIYDGYKNPSLGLLFFKPFDLAPCNPGCNLTVTATATKSVVCVGDSTSLVANIFDINSVYTAVWNPGGHTGTSITVTPIANTTYTVVVTDSSGCHDSAYVTVDTMFCSNSSHSCSLTISAFATHTLVCNGDSTTLSVNISDPITVHTAIWNPGSFNGNTYHVTLTVNTIYTVVVTDSSGCTATATVTVDTMYCAPPSPCSSLSPPSICYVTTDTSSTFNTVVWQKIGMDTLAIDSVIIYRQNILNTYVPIGEVSVHAHTKFNDYTAHPLVEPYFYALGIHDSCGTDTMLSNFNETVFLQSSASNNPNTVNLNWNFYQGTPVIYYRILRDDSGRGNWHAIDSVQGSIDAYSDRSAPINSGLRYMINTDWNISCMPSAIRPPHSSHYVFNTRNESYSNMTYIFPTGLATILDAHSINIYPNPTNDAVFIAFNTTFEGTMKITDVLGQDVYVSKLSAESGSVKKINVSNLSSGVYFISLEGNGKLYRTKIIKM